MVYLLRSSSWLQLNLLHCLHLLCNLLSELFWCRDGIHDPRSGRQGDNLLPMRRRRFLTKSSRLLLLIALSAINLILTAAENTQAHQILLLVLRP